MRLRLGAPVVVSYVGLAACGASPHAPPPSVDDDRRALCRAAFISADHDASYEGMLYLDADALCADEVSEGVRLVGKSRSSAPWGLALDAGFPPGSPRDALVEIESRALVPGESCELTDAGLPANLFYRPPSDGGDDDLGGDICEINPDRCRMSEIVSGQWHAPAPFAADVRCNAASGMKCVGITVVHRRRDRGYSQSMLFRCTEGFWRPFPALGAYATF
jgi:hypothetical protein